MPTLIIPIGFSGAGKTRYFKKKYYNSTKAIYISKDVLRIKMCGDINDQSQNKKIAIISGQLLLKTIEEHLNDNINIYYDNINLNILSTVKKYLRDYPTLKVKMILFMDSLNPQLRIQRVQNDLNHGINRANTTMVINDNEIDLFNKNVNNIMKFYKTSNEKDIIDRLTIIKLENNKTSTLYRIEK